MVASRSVLSVVVPARADDASVRRLLLRLEAQTVLPDEVIIVDDASEPPLADGTIRLDAQSGSYAARNRGIEAARGDVIAFTDVDCAPDDAWLQAGLTAIEHSPRVAGRIELVGAESLVEQLDRARFLRQDRYVAEGFGATANLFVRREVFAAIGVFDARLISGGDAEHGRRATRGGFPIVLAPDAVVRHPCRDGAAALLAKAHRVGFGFGQTARLHGIDRSTAGRATDRLRISAGASRSQRALLAAGMVALHGATLVGVVRGYLAGGEHR